MRKTYWDGNWHFMLDDGGVGERCDAPTDEERTAIAAETTRMAASAPPRPKQIAGGEPCPSCGAKLPFAWNTNCRKCGQVFVETGGAEVVRLIGTPYLPPAGMKIYKVLTQRDEYFRSQFNPEALQTLINLCASDGWRVVSMTATDVGSFFGSFWAKGGGASRQELIVLLEKTVE